MSQFVVRVELHHGSDDDYQKLHENMYAKGYKRSVTGGDGNEYKLPTATYDKTFSGSVAATTVRDEVRKIASVINQNAWVYVNRYDDSAWFLSTMTKAA